MSAMISTLFPLFSLTVTICELNSLGSQTLKVCSSDVELNSIGGVSEGRGARRDLAVGDSSVGAWGGAPETEGLDSDVVVMESSGGLLARILGEVKG